jgi:PleD family two-component response regulator
MGKTVEALIKAADSAMYRAKDGGKNRLFFAREKT